VSRFLTIGAVGFLRQGEQRNCLAKDDGLDLLGTSSGGSSTRGAVVVLQLSLKNPGLFAGGYDAGQGEIHSGRRTFFPSWVPL